MAIISPEKTGRQYEAALLYMLACEFKSLILDGQSDAETISQEELIRLKSEARKRTEQRIAAEELRVICARSGESLPDDLSTPDYLARCVLQETGFLYPQEYGPELPFLKTEADQAVED